LGGFGGVGGPVGDCVRTVAESANKGWWALGDVGESEDGGVLAHAGAVEIGLNSS